MLLSLMLLTPSAWGQELVAGPYLQNPTGTSIVVRWETSSGSESTVLWGTSESPDADTAGTSSASSGGGVHHVATLNGLTPGERIYYRVVTGTVTTDTAAFTLPPGPGDDAGVSLVAMSDMQIDPGNPDKFRELVEDGVVPYVEAETGLDIDQALDLVLIPGDLVDWGWDYGSFAETYFEPGARLFERVASYPVPGNHEADSPYFFELFTLPENGTAGVEEHWWWADHGNLRVVGLDSNSGYDGPEQLAWLDGVLADACGDDALDFVLAQLHHPALSELWVPGESAFTVDVVARLETFTSTCGKPSLHLFGHTHGYSRGQSRDTAHLWVNVATAGGNIDYWGEYEQADYDEFSVTFDEYGFSLIDVDAGDDPSLTLRRITRGDETTPRDNVLVDALTVYRHGTAPETPVARFPVDEVVDPDCVALEATPFADTGGEGHGASHWQVSTSCDDWSDPLVDRWIQHENWWFDVDLQASDALTDEEVRSLVADASWCWRVRYRDQGLAWSEWSVGQAFETGSSSLGGELVVNGGAESGTEGWTVVEGVFEALGDGECGGVAPYEGERYFAVGGLCESTAFAQVVQSLDVSEHADAIDDQAVVAHASAAMADWSGSDLPQAQLVFLGAKGDELGRGPLGGSAVSTWTVADLGAEVPSGTRSIDVVLTGTRNAGTDNDSYFDAVSVRLGPAGTDCARWDGGTGDTGDTATVDTGGETGTQDSAATDTGPTGGQPTGELPPETTDDCGCSSGGLGGSGVWWVWAGLLGAARRRRA